MPPETMPIDGETKIILSNRIRINISQNFYLRTGWNVWPINEWLKRFHSGARQSDEKGEKYFQNCKTQFLNKWVEEINRQISITPFFSGWELVHINNPSRQYRNIRNGTENPSGRLDHMNFPTLPSYILQSKQGILLGKINQDITEEFTEEIKKRYFGKSIKILDLKFYFWFFDWNSGGTDFDISFEVNPSRNWTSRLKEVRKFAYTLKGIVNEFLERENMVDLTGQVLYSSFNTCLGELPDPDGFPPSRDKIFAKKYADFSKSLFLSCYPKTPIEHVSSHITFREIKEIFGGFSADFPAEALFIENPNETIRLISNGYNGNCILHLISNDNETRLALIRTIWLWKMANFYTAGLSKLIRRLVLYNLKLTRLPEEDWLKKNSDLVKFPEFKAKKVTYLNEMRFDVRADHDFDIHVYGSAWQSMKGAEYHEMVVDLLHDLSDFIHVKQDNLKLEYEEKLQKEILNENARREKEKERREEERRKVENLRIKEKEEEDRQRGIILRAERETSRKITTIGIILSATILSVNCIRLLIGDSWEVVQQKPLKLFIIVLICIFIPFFAISPTFNIKTNPQKPQSDPDDDLTNS